MTGQEPVLTVQNTNQNDIHIQELIAKELNSAEKHISQQKTLYTTEIYSTKTFINKTNPS